MKYVIYTLAAAALLSSATQANTVSESQQQYVKKYAKQENVPVPEEMLLNTDAEPDLKKGFVNLYNGTNLEGWTPLGGQCTFEPKGDVIIGTCVPGSPSTYLSTDKSDYADFIFTAELKWEVNGNTGVMFRGQQKSEKNTVTVFGPQAEMEGIAGDRRWSGGIYGQSAGGWYYPLWLESHEAVRNAIVKDGWNRITIMAQGDTFKTWINGIPASHLKNTTYKQGFFSLQVHSGKVGKIHFRNIKVKEL
jgi:hypothetical protein